MRAAASFGLAIAFSEGAAKGLVRFNDGTDQVYVNGTFSIGHTSNLAAAADGTGGYSYGTSVGLEYRRHAGLITVNATAVWTLTRYLGSQASKYNTFNPTYGVEFDKGTGRTTGAVTFGAARSAQSDVAANVHDVSWNYSAGLNVKYPVIDRYSLSGSVNYDYLDYVETGGQPLVNLDTLGASVGMFYILDDEHDLYGTYRYRDQQSSESTNSVDNALLFGVNGRVLWEINGSISIGYQIRKNHGITAGEKAEEPTYKDFTGNAQLAWHLNRKIGFAASASKDFNTTSTNATTDATNGTLDGTYDYSAVWHTRAGIGGGTTRFLGPFGLIQGTSVGRRDYDFTWNAGLGFTQTEHLHVDFGYTYLRNWSNLALASFVNNAWTLTFTTRW